MSAINKKSGAVHLADCSPPVIRPHPPASIPSLTVRISARLTHSRGGACHGSGVDPPSVPTASEAARIRPGC